MIKILKELFNVFFPKYCVTCGDEIDQNRALICLDCLTGLPLTDFSSWPKNRLEVSFKGRIRIEEATSLLYFHKKGLVQKLIHQLKYHGNQEIGTFIGAWLSEEMMLSNRFKTIDFIIPVPLHPDKEKQRGYNQVTTFALSLSKGLNIPMREDVLIKVSGTGTQTLRNRMQRNKSNENHFTIRQSQDLIHKHILVVDDIITSGATMEMCCGSFSQIEGLKISLACMAYTP